MEFAARLSAFWHALEALDNDDPIERLERRVAALEQAVVDLISRPPAAIEQPQNADPEKET